jgi:F0F1-type ATP synthase assembly protein I
MGDDQSGREMGRLFALSQVGVEMVVPIAIGLYLDNKLGWNPWGVVVGAILGLVGGLFHLIVMLRRFEEKDSSKRQDGS